MRHTSARSVQRPRTSSTATSRPPSPTRNGSPTARSSGSRLARCTSRLPSTAPMEGSSAGPLAPPDAELVNTMLDAAIEPGAETTDRPVVHSDRGGHYSWPGWLSRKSDANSVRSKFLAQPRGDVSLAVKHSPNINGIFALNVKDQIRIARQIPGAKPRKIQFMRVATGAGRWIAADVV